MIKSSAEFKGWPALEYSAIVDRPATKWPQGKQLAVYFILNVEHFELGTTYAHTVSGKQSGLDYRNYAWREYGLRVGFWRIMDCFSSMGVPLTHLLNSQIVVNYPRIAEAIKAANAEVLAHGRSNSEHVVDMIREEEASVIREVTEILSSHFDQPIRGWLSPWIAQSEHTLDLLADAGYQYVLDFSVDDQPVRLSTEQNSIVAMPYSVELNDTPALLARMQTAASFEEMFIDQLEMFLTLSEEQALVMAVPLHTFVFGQAFRLRRLYRMLSYLQQPEIAEKVWITTPNAIMDHYLESH